MKTFENFTTKKSNTIKFIEKSRYIHDNKYDYSEVDYKNNNTKVIIICPIHGRFKQIPRSHTSGIGCPKCGKGTLTRDEFIEKSLELHNDKYDYSLVSNDIENTKNVDILCREHGVFRTTPYNHLRGIGCSKCSGNRKLTTDEFIQLSKNKYSKYNYNYDKTIYTGYSKSCTITCPIHGDFEVLPSLHLNGNSHCNRCSDRKIWDFDYFVDSGNKIHNNKYLYDKETFINSSKSAKITCRLHGDFYQSPESHIRLGRGCPVCSESRGEKAIANFLINNNIKYERYKKFDDCKNKLRLPFDFYLPDFNMCIEFDGIQHFEPVKRFGGVSEFEKVKLRDKIKDEYCRNNNIKLVRIDNINDIENKLKFLCQ